MKKIAEIDSVEIYQKTQLMPRHEGWWEVAFTEPQQRFLKKHHCVSRPHPKHSPTVELFIDEHSLTERDWTLLALLFTRPRC